jgi:hypothetical protein
MQLPQNTSRKKFLVWGASVLSSFAILKLNSGGKKKKTDRVKMLTQDGTLVEIDREKVPGSKRKKITDEQLKAWVIKKQM